MESITEFRPDAVRILVVDDDLDLRMTLADYLDSLGFSVESARSGGDAVGLLSAKDNSFDIVVTDLMMPGVDGLAVLRTARRVNPLSHVVVMTGYSSLKTAIESVRSGAFDYLTKPFELVQVEIVVNRIVENQRLASDNRRLNRKVSMLTEGHQLVEARLSAIENLLSSLVANVDKRDNVLTSLDI